MNFARSLAMIDAWDNLQSATLELVRSTPIKQRLVAAYRRNLSHVSEDQLPTEARAPFCKVMSMLGGVRPQRGEDAVTASVRKMSAQDADDCAALIVEIFGLVARTDSGSSQRQTAAVVQLRAVETSPAEPAHFELPVLTAAS
jgi:hypothetical protein